MAKKTLQRKKPGFTKAGLPKIVSLGYQQLHDLMEKTQKKKTVAKIRNRMALLAKRPGFVNPIPAPVEAAVEETQPV